MAIRKMPDGAWLQQFLALQTQIEQDNPVVSTLEDNQFSISAEPVLITGNPKVRFTPRGGTAMTMTLTVDFDARERADGSPIPLTYDCGVFEDAGFDSSYVDLRVEFDSHKYVSLVIEVGTPVRKGRYGS